MADTYIRKDDWRTPPEVWEPLNAEFEFDLDAAAMYDNALCLRFLDDALVLDDWPGERIFCNPPYGGMVAKFIAKASEEAAKGKTVVCLVPVRTRAEWWHKHVIGRASEIRFIRKRVHYIGPTGRAGLPTFDSCLVIFGTGQGLRVSSFHQLDGVRHKSAPGGER